MFFLALGHAQQNSISKPLYASIEMKYLNQNSPVQLQYLAHPFGGSGQYEYRWRTKDGQFEEFGNEKIYNVSFDCSTNDTPECTVHLQVRDKKTFKIYDVEYVHIVDFCN